MESSLLLAPALVPCFLTNYCPRSTVLLDLCRTLIIHIIYNSTFPPSLRNGNACTQVGAVVLLYSLKIARLFSLYKSKVL